jgi:hypothetical protein
MQARLLPPLLATLTALLLPGTDLAAQDAAEVDENLGKLRAFLAEDSTADPGARAATAAELLAEAGKPLERLTRIYQKQIAVAVRGPWRVAERDVFGRATCWRLPIHAAVTNAALRARGIARVFDRSICALEGAPGAAPQAPPFDGCWVGDNWMIRLDKLPR